MPTLSTSARNASVDARTDLLDAGSGPGILRIRDAGNNVLVDITLNDPAFAAAAGGEANADISPVPSGTGTAAAGSGTVANNYQALDSDLNVHWSGGVGIAGSGADLELDNTSIAENQTVSISSWVHRQPA